MTTYAIQAPNGKTYHIDGPEGANDDQVRAEVLKQYPDADPSAAPATPAATAKATADWNGQHVEFDVPAGASDAQIHAASLAALAPHVKVPAGATQQLTRLPNGNVHVTPGRPYEMPDLLASKVSMGLTDKIGAGIDAGFDLARGKPGSLSENYQSHIAESDRARSDYQQAHPVADWASLPANIVGAGGVGGPMSIAQMARTGAGVGAVAGVGNSRGSLLQQAEQTALSTAGGAVLGPIIGTALPAVINGGRAVVRGVSNMARSVVGKEPLASAPSKSGQILLNDLAEQDQTPTQAAAMVADAHANNVPMTLMDTGDATRGRASALSRKPGPARKLIRDRVLPRQVAQTERVQGAIERDLGPTVGTATEAQRLTAEAKTASAPIYHEAMEGGSMAPLESQFEDAFAQSSGAVNAAKRELQDAANRQTQSAAKMDLAGDNVYGQSAARRGTRSADDLTAAAQDKLTKAEAEHAAHLERLRGAQEDKSANAPGAIWSPRIQQFLDDPIARSGLASGVEVQRLEALAEGKPFDPTELAITGMDESGQPIVSKVPNMRTLHTVKIGLDAELEKYPRDIGGNLILDQRGRAVNQVKKALVAEIDRLNPKYAEARAAFAGPMAHRDALEAGKAALNKSADEISAATKHMSADQLDQYRLGLRSAISDAAASKGDYADTVHGMIKSPKKRAALAQVFGGEKQFGRFMKTLEQESQLSATHTKVNTGSSTAVNLADDANLEGISGVAANAGMRLVKGHGIPSQLLGFISDLAEYGSGKSGERLRTELAGALSSDPGEIAAAIKAARRAAAALRARKPDIGRKGGVITGGRAAASISSYGRD